MFDLTDKIAVVTGAGSGIGRAIAGCLADAGAMVCILDSDDAAGAAVAGFTPRSRFTHVDVSDTTSVAEAARDVLAAYGGRLDVLVNCAGIGHVGTVLTTTPQDVDRLFRVNVHGLVLMTQALLPTMIGRHAGSVINIASLGGVIGLRDRLAYCATKFAVVGMTKCMALDHATTGVRFNAICPGRVDTPFITARLHDHAKLTKGIPEAGTQSVRMAQPQEIATAAVFFASDESAFVTGSTLVIDGGISAGK